MTSGRFRPLDLLLITLGFVVEASGVTLLFFDRWRLEGAVLIVVGVVLVVRISVRSRQRIATARRKLPNRSEELNYPKGQ